MSELRCVHGAVRDGAYRCPDCTDPKHQGPMTANERLHRWIDWWESVIQPLGVGASDSDMRRYLAIKFINRQQEPEQGFDFVAHLHRQRAFSEKTFGPGPRPAGIVKHIEKELDEIVESPTDLSEWIDVVILALDGAWRAGHEPEAIVAALEAKQAKNENRAWPDWRTAPPDGPIEHDRSNE